MIPQTTGASQLDEVVGETMKAQGAAANVRILGWQCCLKIFQLHSWNATYFRHFRMIEGVWGCILESRGTNKLQRIPDLFREIRSSVLMNMITRLAGVFFTFSFLALSLTWRDDEH